MKLSSRTFTILWDAHAWLGVLCSVVLFAVFFLGPFSLFWKELGPWQERLLEPAEHATPSRVLELAQQEVDRGAAAQASRVAVEFPADGVPWMKVQATGAGGDTQVHWVHPSSGERVAQRSELGYFLFAMHFLEPIPGGMKIAGIAAVALLFLLATGLTIQLTKELRELVQFRPTRRPRVFWADMHKVTGVLGLPFMVVFAWSGAFLCLNAWLLPAFVAGSFGGDASVIERAEGWRAPTSPSGEAMAAPEVRLLLSRAEEALPHASLKNFVLYHPGDRNASADIRGGYDESLSYYTNARMKRTGEVEWVIGPENARPRAQFFGALHGIHFAKWASLTLRVVYALLSLLAALCILTGCLVWLARRGALRPTLGDAILARLLSGGCAGLCFAVAVLFLVNRALPDAIPERAAWEHISFFVAWSAAVVYAGLWPHAARAAWWLLRIAAVLLFAAPLVDALYTGRAPFDPRPFGYQFGVELGLLLLCLLLLATGRVVRRVEAYADRASIMDKDPAAALEDLAR